MSRDPRKNPQPGDVLRYDGYTRTVTFVSFYGRTTHVSYHEKANVYGEHDYGEFLTNWRHWARKAEVVK